MGNNKGDRDDPYVPSLYALDKAIYDNGDICGSLCGCIRILDKRSSEVRTLVYQYKLLVVMAMDLANQILRFHSCCKIRLQEGTMCHIRYSYLLPAFDCMEQC